MKKGCIVMLTGVAVLSLAGCGASSGSGTLTVGVRDDINGFSYLNQETNKYYGFEIDLSQELAQRLGYADVEYVTVTPESRKDTLLNGEVDCLVSAYSIAESRLENFDFSPAYYHDHAVVMVENSTMIESLEDLVGKTIGTVEGADTAPVLSEKMIGSGLITAEDTKGTSLSKMASYGELSDALENGTIDAVCMDGCIARAYMQDDRTILEETISDEDYGIATQKGSQLSKSVEEAVSAMLEDGTVDKLMDKWD